MHVVENTEKKPMSGANQQDAGIKHVQVRLSTSEYNKMVDAAGEVALQRFMRNALMKASGEDQPPSELDGLQQDDRTLVLATIRYLEDPRTESSEMKPVFRGVIRKMLDGVNTKKRKP